MKITRQTPKEEIITIGKICKSCGHCCSMGAGFAHEDELDVIAKHLGLGKDEMIEKYFDRVDIFNKKVFRPKLIKQNDRPFGPCLFLKDKRCSIHEVKPLHCRVGNCGEHGNDLSEWYTVNHLVDKDDPQSIREWTTRVALKPTIDGAKPIDLVGDKKKLRDILDYEIY